MFCYLTSYRFYTLAKLGFGLAYLWFIGDFLRIHFAYWHGLDSLLEGSSNQSPFPAPALIGTLSLLSPFAVLLYLWGRNRWLQFAVGCWMSVSMALMVLRVGIFCSTADIWLNYSLLTYSLAALVCPRHEWSRREPGFSLKMWRDNPIIGSTYAWLVVLVAFTVYLFAGINKLIDGWEPWTTGVALQNLAFDSSMHDYDRGIPVPYIVSLVLCYVTLFQRLVVPWGFYVMRYRGWAVLILGSMHLGYDLLMQVAIFPLIGISGLMMIVPPRKLAVPLFSRPSLHQPRPVRSLLKTFHPLSNFARGGMIIFTAWFLLESARLTIAEAATWEKHLALVPAWRMFADGGINAGKKWKLLILTPYEERDQTPRIVNMLPHLWRDRFYLDEVLHSLLKDRADQRDPESDPFVHHLVETDEKAYADEQRQLGRSPLIIRSHLEILPGAAGAPGNR